MTFHRDDNDSHDGRHDDENAVAVAMALVTLAEPPRSVRHFRPALCRTFFRNAPGWIRDPFRWAVGSKLSLSLSLPVCLSAIVSCNWESEQSKLEKEERRRWWRRKRRIRRRRRRRWRRRRKNWNNNENKKKIEWKRSSAETSKRAINQNLNRKPKSFSKMLILAPKAPTPPNNSNKHHSVKS